MQGEIVEPKPTKSYDDYVDMPALKQTMVKNTKKDNKGYMRDPSNKSEEDMLVSGLSEDSSYNLGEGLIKDKKADKYRRNVPKNQRVSQQNYVGEDSASNLVPGRGRGYNMDSGRVGRNPSNAFDEFEEILEPQRPKAQIKPQGLLTGPNMLVEENNSFAELGAPRPSKKNLDKYYKNSDEEDNVG